MKRLNMNKLLLIGSHAAAVVAGFASGIYALPILTAPETPSTTELAMLASGASYRGEFRRDLKGSDALHWGEGTVYVGAKAVTLMGQLAPGPDYKLYLSPEFVETEADFKRLKSSMARVGAVHSRRPTQVQGLPPGGWRFGRNHGRVTGTRLH